jgi:small subunit ribosomal protein S16
LYDENANARPYKEIALDRARAKYWLGVGAQPSDPVWKLMSMVRELRFEVGQERRNT